MEYHAVQQQTKCFLFSKRLLSRYGDITWPARSPDFHPRFIFVGLPKGPGIRQQTMKQFQVICDIRNKTNQSIPETLTEFMKGVITRTRLYGKIYGGHFKIF
jgi:hypothetical protein